MLDGKEVVLHLYRLCLWNRILASWSWTKYSIRAGEAMLGSKQKSPPIDDLRKVESLELQKGVKNYRKKPNFKERFHCASSHLVKSRITYGVQGTGILIYAKEIDYPIPNTS